MEGDLQAGFEVLLAGLAIERRAVGTSLVRNVPLNPDPSDTLLGQHFSTERST